ncbi:MULTISPECIES: DUF932 domain-containing protein [Paraburkholderia]|uniref:DUF932 domain-containing protein n=1 Tax=Paraburkholderia madseniana TaxID=2599607 RepID=A0AAP5BEZ6_9BURK|nr:MULTISPECIES: DUF932 domain-containing protein [Paraburkholderia]MCX4146911.1 DUF932 domain-containing protein [Paraburkholderia madseniana]MDN7149857.1 DUF932 domain-containing protein [Paraburkholderia sp. WS6]MDQ6408737.1 DUF932 domain-containing protein [Paraburkholderia madseniana]
MHLVQSMAYVNEVPWHGLGNQLAPNQPLEVWARASGMDWKIEESEVRFVAGTSGLGSIHAFPEQKVLYRSDTKAPLSVVSSRYQVVQPAEILDFYKDLTEVSGFELETAGVLKDGKKLWALARTGQSATLRGKDQVNGYLLLATACDGSLATVAQFTSVRVVCHNTLSIALANDSTGAVKVPHRSQFDAQAVKRQLGIAVSSWDGFMVRMKALAERKVSDSSAEAFFRRVLTYPAAGPNMPTPATNDSAIKAVQALYAGRGKGATLPSASGTAWGLVNSITEFVDHQRRARSDDHRRDAAWFGAGATLKQKAWDEAMKLVA